jgi:Na+/melibiose symporter-like transporter
MTPDYSERFTMQIMRVLASVLGQLASFGVLALLAKYLNNAVTGIPEPECEKIRFLVIGGFAAVLVIICVGVFVLLTRDYRGVLPIIEQQRISSPKEAKVIVLEALQGIKKIMSVRAYLITVLQYCTAFGAFQITLTMVRMGKYKPV